MGMTTPVQDLKSLDTFELRLVRLRVQPVPWMGNYYGREAGLIDHTIDAVEIKSSRHVGFIDDRDGEAGELAEAVSYARESGDVPTIKRFSRQLLDHAKRYLLHGEVVGVRRML